MLKLPLVEFPIIQGKRITLREIHSTDLLDILDISYYDGQKASTVEQAATMQNLVQQNYLEGSSVHWGIALNESNKLVGTCGYYRGFDKESGELGCILLPQYYGSGYMTEAMLLAIGYGKNTLRLKRIWAETSHSNQAAINLLDRLEFTKTADINEDVVIYDYVY